MGFIKRAIRRGVSDALGKAIQQAVEPKATELANQAAEQLERAGQSAVRQQTRTETQLEGAFGNLKQSMESYATQVAQNLKQCPSCGESCGADKKFCPNCGSKLPETTVAQGAVCPSCGKQNNVGTKFCSDCGTKLPAAVAEEQARQNRNAQALAQWAAQLPQYPQWTCGGDNFVFEPYDGYIMFCAEFNGNHYAAKQAVEQYRQIALQAGFRSAGQYPSKDQLYNKIDGVCYHIDLEHCFDGDSDCPCIYFNTGEPSGGFDYVKPEPTKQVSFRDLFKF